jgi:hypothetical protein
MAAGGDGGFGAAPRAVLEALLVGASCLLPGARAGDDDDTAPAAAGYLRCPECGLEMPGADPGHPVLCPRCGAKKVAMEFSTTGRASDGSPASSSRFPLLMAGFVAALVVALAVLKRVSEARGTQRQPEARQEPQANAAEREEVARWHADLKRQAARRRERGD